MTNRNQIRLIQQDICCHQCGIGKQATVDIFGVLGGLVLKLGHTAQFPKHGIAVQHPAQLCMLVYMGLDKQGILLRVEATGNILCQLLQRTAAQIRGILANSNGMHVCHKVEALIQIRPCAPVLNCTQVIPQMQITGGLDAGKHSFPGCVGFGYHLTHNAHTPFQNHYVL